MLELKHVTILFEKKIIVDDFSFSLKPGEIVLLMGPNGSGKSTIASSVMGNPQYTVSAQSKFILDREDITKLPIDERARKGLFLAFQNPVSIPGVSIVKLLRELFASEKGASKHVLPQLKEYAQTFQFKDELLTRGMHEGFSGGEKKKIEMLQAHFLAKKYALFDEIDTGLDIDALKKVAHGINELKKRRVGCLVITHYGRLADFLNIDRVVIIRKGKLVKEGPSSLIHEIEKTGYANI